MSTPQSKPIPHFREPWLLGSWSDFMKLSNRLDLLLRVARECGEVGRFRIGPLAMYIINSPALLTSVMLDHADDMHTKPFYRTIWPVMGRTSMVSASGDYHRRLRRIMAPAFTPKRLQSYGRDMVVEVDAFLRGLKDETEIEVVRQMQKIIRNIFMKTIFAVDLGENDSFFESVRVVAEYIGDGVSNPIRPPLSIPTPYNRKSGAAIAHVRNRAADILKQVRARGEDKGDVLSMLMRAKDEDGTGLSEVELLDQAVTLYLAGFESTANTVTIALLLLAKHPDIQARMQAELDAALGGRTPTPEELPKLPFMLQVVKETMRLYPAGTLFARSPEKDINILGYDFPKDSFLAICPYVVHRNTEFFPDPERFLPERFSPENEKKLPRNAYIPFGTGPKVCIGQHLAVMEVQMVLACLLQNLSVALPANFTEVDIRPLATLTPSPFNLKMIRRKPVLAMVS